MGEELKKLPVLEEKQFPDDESDILQYVKNAKISRYDNGIVTYIGEVDGFNIKVSKSSWSSVFSNAIDLIQDYLRKNKSDVDDILEAIEDAGYKYDESIYVKDNRSDGDTSVYTIDHSIDIMTAEKNDKIAITINVDQDGSVEDYWTLMLDTNKHYNKERTFKSVDSLIDFIQTNENIAEIAD